MPAIIIKRRPWGMGQVVRWIVKWHAVCHKGPVIPKTMSLKGRGRLAVPEVLPPRLGPIE